MVCLKKGNYYSLTVNVIDFYGCLSRIFIFIFFIFLVDHANGIRFLNVYFDIKNMYSLVLHENIKNRLKNITRNVERHSTEAKKHLKKTY